MAKTLIRIGHCSYAGTNALQWAKSRARAIEILRQRGVLRDAARAAVAQAMSKPHGYASARAGWDGVEICNEYDNAVRYGWDELLTATPKQIAGWAHRAY